MSVPAESFENQNLKDQLQSLFGVINGHEDNLDTVRTLLNSNPLLAKTADSYGETALHQAVGTDKPALVTLLLEYGADINAQNNNHETPLLKAVQYKDPDYEMIRFLLNQGADVTKVAQTGQSVLHAAVYKRRRDIVTLIITHHKNVVAITDRQGMSALELVIRLSFKDMVELLLQLNPEIINATEGSGLLTNAAIIGNEEIVSLLLTYPEIVKTLNIANSAGITPLFFARDCSRHSIVRLFLKAFETIERNEAAEDFIQKCQVVSDTANILGLEGDFAFKRKDLQKIEAVDFSGGISLTGILTFARCIRSYCDSFQGVASLEATTPEFRKLKKYFARIQQAAEAAVCYFNFDCSPEEGIDLLLANLDEHKPVMLQCTTPGHAMGLALYKDKQDKYHLVVCDRAGEYDETLGANRNSHSGGTKIYTIDPKQITAERLIKLTTWGPLGMSCSREERKRIISEITQGKEPEVVLPSKCQIHDNCTFIHQKSMMEGILYLFEIEHLEDSENKLLAGEVVSAAKAQAERGYKRFTTFIRNTEVNLRIDERQEILRKLKAAETAGHEPDIQNLKEDLEFYNSILIVILNQHHGQLPSRKVGDVERQIILREAKVTHELQRAKAILTSFDRATKEAIQGKFKFDLQELSSKLKIN